MASMLIKVCDRCGAEFKGSCPTFFAPKYELRRRAFPLVGSTAYALELCDACLEELREFMENREAWADPAPEVSIQLDDCAYLPERAHSEDAGLDLFTPYATTVPALGSTVIDTGVHVELPKGTAGVLMSKSGLNVKRGITSTGLIDEGYTGSIKVKLYNHTASAVPLPIGTKVSQLVIVPVLRPVPVQVETIEGGERGDNGFGSTGKYAECMEASDGTI